MSEGEGKHRARRAYGLVRLNPVEIRRRWETFRRVHRGYARDEVRDFLAYVALQGEAILAENARFADENARLRDHNERLRRALHEWKRDVAEREQARAHPLTEFPPHPPNYGTHHGEALPHQNSRNTG